MKLDLNLLQVFDAVYTSGGITPAAKKLGLTQPSVSNALKRLRGHMGDPLFERVGNKFMPTAEAHRLAPIVHEALQAIDQGISLNTVFDPASSERTFSLMVPDAIEPLFFNDLLQQTYEQSPGISYATQPMLGVNLVDALLDKTFDLGFTFLPIEDPQLNSTFLIDDDACIAVRADHPVYKDRDELTVADMNSVGLVSITPELRNLTHLEHEMRARNVQRRIVCTVSRMWSIPYIVARTDLAGAVSKRMVEMFADDLNLKLFKPPVDRPTPPWFMAWHKDQDDDPAHRWLRDVILAVFSELRAADTGR